MKKLGWSGGADLDPAEAEALARQEEQQATRLERREQRAELALAIVTLWSAIALVALAPSQHLDAGLAVALGLAIAIARRVKFYDGSGYTVATQVVFVPTLLLLPAASVPLVVIVALTVGEADRYVRGEAHAQRAVMNIGDSFYALGPALVLVLAGVDGPSWQHWPIYVVALAAQFAFDFAGTAMRDWLAVGFGADLGLPLFLWTWLVDALLSTLGLMAALAARDNPYGALLVLPFIALLAIFSREREARIEHSLELSRAYRGTTLLLSDVLDEDDEYTAFHSRGVVQLSIAVAERMQLDARQMRNVEFGALLHDIGKIAIPKDILHKPGKLSEDEWVVMKTHTVEGQKLLDRVGGVLGDVGRVVRSSHERWDGGGYPDGLTGEEIPIEASIVSACDAFNAMTTHRPYRRALEPREAIAELLTHRGAQFAPSVVDVLVELIENDGELVGPAEPEQLPITVAMVERAVARAG